jgi:hypothetical protein
MDELFRYFWFWCGAFWMVLIVTTVRPRLAESVRHNQITADEAAAFVRGLAISIAVPCVALGLIALAGKRPAPFCIEPFFFGDLPSAASNGVTLIAWAALLGWVWFGSGAILLGRIAPALMTPPNYTRRYSPGSVRVIVTLLLVITAVGALIGWRSVPQERPSICSASEQAHAGRRAARAPQT